MFVSVSWLFLFFFLLEYHLIRIHHEHLLFVLFSLRRGLSAIRSEFNQLITNANVVSIQQSLLECLDASA